MKRTLLAALVSVAVATTFTPVAQAAPPGRTDFGCGFVGATDPGPDAPENTITGLLFGGPIRHAGDDVKLKCTIKAGVYNHLGTTPNSAAKHWHSTLGVVVGADVVSFNLPPDTNAYLCGQFYDGTVTWYWDGANHGWSPDSDVACELAIGTGTDDPIFDPIFDLLDSIERDIIDPLVCPVLAALQGNYVVVSINSQGDVFLLGEPFLDCPPYDLGLRLSDVDINVIVVIPAI